MKLARVYMKRIVLLNKKKILMVLFAAALIALLLFGRNMILLEKSESMPLITAQLQKVELSSSEYPYYAYMLSDAEKGSLSAGISYKYHADQRIQKLPPDGNYRFSFEYGNEQRKIIQYNYLLDEYYDENYKKIVPSKNCISQLNELIHVLNKNAHYTYGALLPWEEVNDIFPLFSYAKVIDIYTGASFMVQRRAGSNHADVQPLTAKDTAVMKKIFHGAWTWNRSGIVLEIGSYRIAGSMNGKPHGAGKIEGNNFPGHFCIHFLNCTTHSGSMDVSHHREILKAAGKLSLASDTT
jgi:hypothetical protein